MHHITKLDMVLREAKYIQLNNPNTLKTSNFIVTPCINNAEPLYYQLMHIMLKNTELLKHSKITLQRFT